jgi:hypothetical protein
VNASRAPHRARGIALTALPSRFRTDALQLITFGRHASTVDIAELTAMDGTGSRAVAAAASSSPTSTASAPSSSATTFATDTDAEATHSSS